jgi:hypothetical protein
MIKHCPYTSWGIRNNMLSVRTIYVRKEQHIVPYNPMQFVQVPCYICLEEIRTLQ